MKIFNLCINRPWILPVAVMVLCICWISTPLQRAPKDNRDINTLGELPIAAHRLMPLESYARSSLLQLSGRSSASWKDNQEQRHRISAVAWWLQLLTQPETARLAPLIRVDHPDVRALFAQAESQNTRFSYQQILRLDLPPQEQTNHLAGLDSQFSAAIQQSNNDRSKLSSYQSALLKLRGQIDLWQQIERSGGIRPIPLLDDGISGEQQDRWIHMGEALQRGAKKDPAINDALVGGWQRIVSAEHNRQQALQTGDTDAVATHTATFNSEIQKLQQQLKHIVPQASKYARVETFFNRTDPFGKSLILYVLATLLLLAYWPLSQLRLAPLLWQLAVGCVLGALIIHTEGIALRMWITGRAPVTNLYSSAVLVGWGGCVFALALEGLLLWLMRWRSGIGIIIGSCVGFSTLLVAQALATDGDTMGKLQAVLDSNFWLSTHVITITLGYSAMFIAGMLGLSCLVIRLTRLSQQNKLMRQLRSILVGVFCFALLFSFVGTILGGIWADQSWGRFWGWDPKENGALMIVLWCAAVLHAHVGGMVKLRGLAVMALIGNIVTAWSWFGVNQMSVGLHAYGFMDGATTILLAFMASQLLLTLLALLPQPTHVIEHFQD